MHQNGWNSDEGSSGAGHLAQGVRMVIAAVASAALTATLVIAVGQSMMNRSDRAAAPSDAVLIRTSN
jgi:hypothetical protein